MGPPLLLSPRQEGDKGHLAAARDRTWRFHLHISSGQSLKYLSFVQEFCENPIKEFLVVVLPVVVPISLAGCVAGLLPMQVNYSSNGMDSSPRTFLPEARKPSWRRNAPALPPHLDRLGRATCCGKYHNGGGNPCDELAVAQARLVETGTVLGCMQLDKYNRLHT